MKSSAVSVSPSSNLWDEDKRDAVRVIVVAPALAWRAGLRALLSAEERIQVVGEAASLGEVEPDLLVFEVLVLAGSSLRLGELEELLQDREPPAVLLLVENEPETARVLMGLPLRAWGVLPVDASAEELLAAVFAVAEGLLAGNPELLRTILSSSIGASRDEDDQPVEDLTEREAEVLQYLAQGLANKQVAAALGISENTVKFHASAIFAKLGAASRTEAVRIGIRRGLVVL